MTQGAVLSLPMALHPGWHPESGGMLGPHSHPPTPPWRPVTGPSCGLGSQWPQVPACTGWGPSSRSLCACMTPGAPSVGTGLGARGAQRPGRGGVRAAASSCLSPRLLLPLRTQGGSPRLGTGWAPATRRPAGPCVRTPGPCHCGPPRCGAGAGGPWPRVPWHAQALRALVPPALHQTSAQAASSSLPWPLPSTWLWGGMNPPLRPRPRLQAPPPAQLPRGPPAESPPHPRWGDCPPGGHFQGPTSLTPRTPLPGA